MKTAVIVGCDGQDGRIACDLLVQKGYKVLGLGKASAKDLGAGFKGAVDITSRQEVFKLFEELRMQDIYYLAAYHHSSQDALPDDVTLIEQSYRVNVLGLSHFLEGIKKYAPDARLFYASSSMIYGNTDSEKQDEKTPYCPDTIYGISKLDGMLLCRYYRQNYNVFASSGILYNHESPLRREGFISSKIINAALDISKGRADQLVLGDLDAEVDWGYAPDYVEAMHCILNAPRADDFIIASGQKHSVKDFVEIAFGYAGLDWKKFVRQGPAADIRKRKALVGNCEKLIKATGWRPSVDFKGMIKLLIEARLKP